MDYDIVSDNATYKGVMDHLYPQIEALRTTDTYGLMHSTLALYVKPYAQWRFYHIVTYKSNDYIQYARQQIGVGDNYFYFEIWMARYNNNSAYFQGNAHNNPTYASLTTINSGGSTIGGGSKLLIIA